MTGRVGVNSFGGMGFQPVHCHGEARVKNPCNGMRPQRPCGWKRTRGFTLVEVLATLVLLGIVVPVAMRGVSIALAAAATARHTAEAATLADAKLNELIADGTWETSGTTGDFEPDHPSYTWTCENLSRDYGTSEVVLHVKWLQRGAERTLSISTLVHASTSSGTSMSLTMGGAE